MLEHSVLGPRRITLSSLEPDTLSSDLVDSLQAQLCSVNRRLD